MLFAPTDSDLAQCGAADAVAFASVITSGVSQALGLPWGAPQERANRARAAGAAAPGRGLPGLGECWGTSRRPASATPRDRVGSMSKQQVTCYVRNFGHPQDRPSSHGIRHRPTRYRQPARSRPQPPTAPVVSPSRRPGADPLPCAPASIQPLRRDRLGNLICDYWQVASL